MFAGLPGMGVGTLLYVLMALWLPVRELVHVLRGTSTVERWRAIVVQFCHAVGIVASITLAERVLIWSLRMEHENVADLGNRLNQQLAGWSPGTLLAAPITASLILLATVLVTVQIARLLVRPARPARREVRPQASLGADVFETP